MHAARALLAAASLAMLAGCSVRDMEPDAPHEAAESTIAALDIGTPWPSFTTSARAYHAGVELGGGRALVCGGKDDTNDFPPSCELLEVHGSTLTSTVYPLPGAGAGTGAGGTAQGRLNPTLTLLPSGGVLIAGGRPTWGANELGARASRPIADWLQTANDPNLNWLSPEAMKLAREEHTATLLGTTVVVFGGYNRSTNPATPGPLEIRSEVSGANALWTLTGTEAPRIGHSATLLKPNGSEARLLIFGGADLASGAYRRTGFIFSLENGVQSIPDMPGPARSGHTATLLDDAHGSVLVVGGETASSPPQYLGDAWRYDPVDNLWSQAGATSSTPLWSRSYHSAARLGSFVIVAGGEGPNTLGAANATITALHSVQSYDWRHDTWSNLRPLSADRAFFQLLKLSETQLVASGGWRRNGTVTANSSDLIALSPLGPLSATAECASGHEADGVCCESDCNGPCQACDADGVCQPLTGTSHSGHLSCAGNLLCANGECPAACDSTKPCAASFFCDGGRCSNQKRVGDDCSASAECANGAPCVDGVCCRSECSGACEACSPGTGICLVLAKGATPLASHPACSTVPGGDPQCVAVCDGVTRDRCLFPGPDSACSAASCENDSLQPKRVCDGQGACQAVAAVEGCAPYTCDEDQKQCLHHCSGSDQCSGDTHCDKAGACVHCDDDLDQCQGFKCDRSADQCKRTCQKSATDCLGGYYCHPIEHRCVAPVEFPASALPACTMGIGHRSSYQSLALAAVALLLLSARRRRFKRSACN
jgi:hypothetical protein